MGKQNFTQDDYARALLRAGIVTCNQQLDDIVANYLGGATIVDDDHGSFVVDENHNNWRQTNNYHQAHRYINNQFFFSDKNDMADSVIGQAYLALGSGQDVFSLLKQEQVATDVRVKMDPVFKEILRKHNEICERIYKHYTGLVYDGKMPLQQAKEEIKKRIPRLNGNEYEGFLKKFGFDGRYLQQAKYFIDIMNHQNTNARVVDFLDTYSLYHYYIFRKAINNRFFRWIKENPGSNRYKKRYNFEQIAREEIHKHCEMYAYDKNAYFDRKRLSLTPLKMDANRAKTLVLKLNEAPEEIRKQLSEHIEQVINQTMQDGRSLKIGEIYINPHTRTNNGGLLKKSNPNLKKKQTPSSVITNITTILNNPDKPPVKVDGKVETISPNPPKVWRPRVVEVSKLPPFESERTKREKERKARIEAEKKRQEEFSKKYTQLTFFDKSGM